MKILYTTELNLSDYHIEILKYLYENRIAEFRGYDVDTLEEFMKTDEFLSGKRGVKVYRDKNPFDLTDDFNYLLETQLVYNDEDAYHTTYKLTELGKKIVSEYLK